MGNRRQLDGNAFGPDLAMQRVERHEPAFMQKFRAGARDFVTILVVIDDKARRLRQGNCGANQGVENQERDDCSDVLHGIHNGPAQPRCATQPSKPARSN